MAWACGCSSGAFHACGSVRKNWTASASVSPAHLSGSSDFTCAPTTPRPGRLFAPALIAFLAPLLGAVRLRCSLGPAYEPGRTAGPGLRFRDPSIRPVILCVCFLCPDDEWVPPQSLSEGSASCHGPSVA